MGKTKSKTIRRAANNFVQEEIEFTDDFTENKKILGKTMPSKKVRNQMAGLLTRMKKQEKAERAKMMKE